MPTEQHFECVPRGVCSPSLQWEVAFPPALELVGGMECPRYMCQPMLTCWGGLGWLVVARAVLRLQLAADMLCGLVVLSREASDVLYQRQ